ncbi:MAG: helix-turn-helix transcriptional regulator [Actinomycetota bacterium]
MRDRECSAFGSVVRMYRRRAGYSQEELAGRAGIHRAYIGGIERGERNPTLRMIHRLARALDVSPSQLLEEPPDSSPRANRHIGKCLLHSEGKPTTEVEICPHATN